MNTKQIHKYVNRYLEATDCSIIEKSPAHFTVKLSPDADRELTNRPYYWSFVDRVGAEPETMTFLFVTDKEKYEAGLVSEAPPEKTEAPDSQAAAADAALVRSFGFINSSVNAPRIPRQDVYFGSQKLEQLFGAAKSRGSFVYLFQEPDKRGASPFSSTPYTAWLGVNIRVEFACDRKREEIHSLGVSLVTGYCADHFHDRLLELRLTPRLPANIHVTKNGISFAKAQAIVEQALERKLKNYDYTWAGDASARLQEELDRIDAYYKTLLQHATDENKLAIQEQYEQRQAETRWQFEPRVTASVINCGVFHLEGIN
ncbi:YqhG family protein [Paenibacillus sp. NPDC057967]|uniref:YqhG family protein n=1 Tax=Paenibacillus sp. NPDC057967 TaxID=3346293 RepID=UPI0036DB73AC